MGRSSPAPCVKGGNDGFHGCGDGWVEMGKEGEWRAPKVRELEKPSFISRRVYR